jgi:transcriptional regulator with XRE-family HTH domain
MKLGAAVKSMREEADVTQEELAERAGTTKSSVSRIENEEQAPSLDMLDRLAAALGVKVYQIMARAEGTALPVAKASREERELLREIKAMEPDVRDHYLAIAKTISRKY